MSCSAADGSCGGPGCGATGACQPGRARHTTAVAAGRRCSGLGARARSSAAYTHKLPMQPGARTSGQLPASPPANATAARAVLHRLHRMLPSLAPERQPVPRARAAHCCRSRPSARWPAPPAAAPVPRASARATRAPAWPPRPAPAAAHQPPARHPRRARLARRAPGRPQGCSAPPRPAGARRPAQARRTAAAAPPAGLAATRRRLRRARRHVHRRRVPPWAAGRRGAAGPPSRARWPPPAPLPAARAALPRPRAARARPRAAPAGSRAALRRSTRPAARRERRAPLHAHPARPPQRGVTRVTGFNVSMVLLVPATPRNTPAIERGVTRHVCAHRQCRWAQAPGRLRQDRGSSGLPARIRAADTGSNGGSPEAGVPQTQCRVRSAPGPRAARRRPAATRERQLAPALRRGQRRHTRAACGAAARSRARARQCRARATLRRCSSHLGRRPRPSGRRRSAR